MMALVRSSHGVGVFHRKLVRHLASLSTRAIHALVVLSFLSPSVAALMPPVEAAERPAAEKHRAGVGDKIHTYQPPVFSNPSPRLAQRPSPGPVTASAGVSPVMFIENVGQFDEQARFQVHGAGGGVFLAADALWVTLLEGLPEDALAHGGLDLPDILAADRPRAGVNLRLGFEGANPSPTIEGFDPLDTTVSYFLGNDPAQWRGDVPVWGGVRYVDLYPGVNLEITSEGGDWAWRMVASRAAFHSLLTERERGLRLRIEGADRLRLVNGQLRMTTDVREITLPLLEAVTPTGAPLPQEGRTPSLYGAGVEHPFETNEPRSGPAAGQELTLGGSGLPGFGAGGVLASPIPSAGQPLAPVFTPGPGGLVYSTYLGGSQNDYVTDIAIDSTEAVYAAGFTTSTNFPVSAGAFQTSFAGNQDAFVAKLTPDGTALAYATYLGGSSSEGASGVVVDGTGSAFVAGSTGSSDFPTSGALQGTAAGNGDAFVTKLAVNGTALLYSTYLGGTASDRAGGVAVDGAGAAYVTGRTGSTDFPTVGALQGTLMGGRNAFVSKVSSSGGSLIYSTYLGGQWDEGLDIAVDSSGAAYVTGYADANFPTTAGSFQPSEAVTCYPGVETWDAFVAKLNGQGNGLVYSTYLGGCEYEYGWGLAVDAAGAAYVAGETCSPDFPVTPGAFQMGKAGPELNCLSPGPDGDPDGFVVKLNPTGSTLVYGTYLGGTYFEAAFGVAVDATGSAHVTGLTVSADFPTTAGAFQGTLPTNGAAYVTKLAADGTALLYSTYLGGSVQGCQGPCSIYSESGNGIKVDASGAAYVGGVTPNSDFPVTAGSFQTSLSGDSDGFITKFDLSGAVLPDDMVRSCGTLKSGTGGPGTADPGECPVSGVNGSTGVAGDPINTHTGGFDYSLVDLSIPTAAGPLVFQRTYDSRATDLYTAPLGFGWTHNHDARLVFPSDPGGEAGAVLFKAHTTNRYRFIDNGDGTFSPFAGVLASLTRNPGPPVTYTLMNSSQGSYAFDESGRLLSRTDPQGRSFTYTYDPSGRVSRVDAPGGSRFLTFGYDGQGRLSTVADHTGRQISLAYSGAGDLASMIDVLGQTWAYTYDAAHRLVRVTDPRLVTEVRVEYDAQGRAVRQFNGANELIVEITYNADGTSTVTDARLNRQTHTYDTRNTLTRQADALGGVTNKVYDPNFRPGAITDPDGDTTQLTWSASGANLTALVDAEGRRTDLTYDALNNLTSVIDPRNFLTTYTYTGTLLTSTTDALNNTTTYTYTDVLDVPAPTGLLETVTDARGNTTRYTYDAFGQRTSMTDALGKTWTYSYDVLGRLMDATDPLGRISHNEYDAAGRLVRTTGSYDPLRPQNDDGQYNIVIQFVYDAVGHQTQVIDTFGRITRSEYDNAGRLIRVTQNYDPARPANDQNQYNLITTYGYDAAGNLTSTTDALGRMTTYAYDALNRLTSTTNPAGSVTTVGYNPDGTVASTTDALGRITSYMYDDLKRVTSVTDAPGNVTRTAYDLVGNVASTTDARGNTTTYAYDALNRLLRQTDPLGGVSSNFYDEVGNLRQSIDANQRATTYAYDALNRLASVTDARGFVTNYGYDAVGNRVSITDARGNATTFAYDRLNRQITATDPLSHISRTEYDALGNATARVDPNGNRTTFAYDAADRLTQQTDPAGGITRFAYDPVGNQTGMTDAKGNTTTTVYDSLNRPTSVTDANGTVTTTGYDAVGNVLSVTDALGNRTSFGYDALNQQTSSTDPLNRTTAYGYDANGNRTSMTDAAGIVTRYEYDALNRLTAVVENYRPPLVPDAQTNVRTEYTYDAVGSRLTIRDGNGNTTTFTYSPTNQLATEADPLLNTTSYGYDQVGNRVTLTDATGAITTFVYDAANRLTTIDYPVPDADVTFAYDANGNRTSMVDGVGTTTWVYDGLNRATSVTGPFAGSVGYGYDAVGNRTSLTYPDVKNVSYAYDPGNRLTGVTDWSAQATSYTYDPADRMTGVTLPNGVVSTYVYDAASQVSSIGHGLALETLSSFQYTYDLVGNRLTAVEELKQPSGVAMLAGSSLASIPGAPAVASVPHSVRDEAAGDWSPISFAFQGETPSPTPSDEATEEPTATPVELSPTATAPEPSPTATAPDPSPTAAESPATASPTPTLELTTAPPHGSLLVDSVGDGADSDPGDGVCRDETGACTLRAAIEEANAGRGPDTIGFNLAGQGPHTIAPASPLPDITDPVTIDGTTQPGYAGKPVIELVGSAAGDAADGLRILAGASSIKGLAIDGFGGSAVLFQGRGGSVLEASFIGLDASGGPGAGNHIGVLVEDSPGNRIGGRGSAGTTIARNTMGIYILGRRSTGNQVEGNIFGFSAAGESALNALDIRVKEARGNSIGSARPQAENRFAVEAAGLLLQGVDAADNSIQLDVLPQEDVPEPLPPRVPLEGAPSAPGPTAGVAGWLARWWAHFRDAVLFRLEALRGAPPSVEEAAGLGQSSRLGRPPAAGRGLFSLSPALSGEPVAVAATFVVNSTEDRPDRSKGDGKCDAGQSKCTLRAAIEEANANPGVDTIRFGISGTGPFAIQPRSPLPTITEPVIIDGTTQPGYAGSPLIEVNGSMAGTAVNGLTVSAGSTTIKGLAINRFDGAGIELRTNGGSRIEANRIGVNPAGTLVLANGLDGVLINAVGSNTVGGTVTSARNLISGNSRHGVAVVGLGATGNLIQGNYIGTDSGGGASLGNTWDGVQLLGAPNNTVGGTAAGARNVLSGNRNGVYVIGTDATGNLVAGNHIGTDAAGSSSLANREHGVRVESATNTIGGIGPEARNVISGNTLSGVMMLGTAATGNFVQGNHIGTDASGSLALGNGRTGVVANNAFGNVIGGSTPGAGNVISDNYLGIYVGPGASANAVQGNYIGTNASGTSVIGNTTDGVDVRDATGNTIGGTAPGARNVISGNGIDGIWIIGASSGNLIQGNYIGTDAEGLADLGNVRVGVTIQEGTNNTIGGTTAAERNVISGNGSAGVYVVQPTASGNLIQGNYIGTNADGVTALANDFRGVQIQNAPNNTVGGTTPGAGNLISGNLSHGIRIVESGATGNVVQGNSIGINGGGTGPLGNSEAGISISASNNTIGGSTAGAGNLIAYNGFDGVFLDTSAGAIVVSNAVLGNRIHDNGGLGVDLFPDGVTPNDSGDADTGANNLQNFPVLASAAGDGASTTVAGTLSSTPSQTYRLEFFANPACDATGYGEGKVFLGSTDVTTDANGGAAFAATLPVAANPGDWVTGTATDPANNTSESSACVQTAAGVSRYNWHYEYDPLYRLTYACSGWDAIAASCLPGAEFFRYTYDAVGNRLTQETLAGTNTYTYDIANRLTSVDGVTYTWDAKGNLLSDGTSTYTYDRANRLISVVQGSDSYTFAYNGLGDRLRQTVNGAPTSYTLDIEGGLTQVLRDNANTYLYGPDLPTGQGYRIGEQAGGWQYHLVDTLRSVRQLAGASGEVTSARVYEPFGSVLTMAGPSTTSFGFTGEATDATGLMHLRARYLNSRQGRFVQADPWPGDTLRPQTLNGFAYVGNNPVTWVDPSGRCYGALSFLREVEPVACRNMDLANIIVASPNATDLEKAIAWSYQLSFTAAHATLAVGLYGLSPAWAATGTVFGGGYAGAQYALAASGKCGCEAQRAALQTGLWESVGAGAGPGLVGGGILGPVAGAGAAGRVAVGTLAGLGSLLGLYSSGRDILSAGPNACNVGTAAVSAVGVYLSARFAQQGYRQLVDERLAGLSVGPRGEYYSVAFEARLSPSSYPGVSRARHFQEANEALLQMMEADPNFLQSMAEMGIVLHRTPTGLAPRQPPAGWTWHHAPEPGVLQLVPLEQHSPGSILWDTLHQGGMGGFAIWGK